MRLLLDTQALIWWATDDPKLGPSARTEILRGGADVTVSVASIWEISIKAALKRLDVDSDIDRRLETAVAADRFRVLPLAYAHARAVRTLPLHHGDPFDRILIVQARLETLTILTADRVFAAYDVPVFSALR